MEKKATRESYGIALKELAKDYKFYVMDADLAKSTKTDTFRKEFPQRFINAGIAESNMMAVSAGIATTGTPVFVSSFAMFVSGRAFEQVRNSVAYPSLNVKIGASHAGISVGEDGATHQCLEDIALMRTLPNMTVISPADHYEAMGAVKAALLHDGPCYLRFGRLSVPILFDENYKFELGKGVTLREGKDVTIVATGYMVNFALEACDMLKEEGISAEVINIHTIKPIDKELLVKSAKKTGCVVTAEEHNVIGGLGSAVCEALCEEYPVSVYRVGTQDVFGRSGTPAELMEYYGLTAKNIAENTKRAINNKK